MGRLTVATVRSLAKPGRYGDGRGSTLYLVIAPGGSKSWVQRVAINGKRHDIGLGGWPLTSLKEARERAFANRKLARDGGDPLAAKRRTRVPTFEQAAAGTFEANRARWRGAKTASSWARLMARYAYPVFGDRRVDQIGREDVLRVLTPIWSSKHALAVKVRGHLRAVLSWCQAHDYVEHNAAGEGIDGALPKIAAVKGHHRALDYREIGAALDAVEASTAGLSARAALRFVVLTACRSGEARGATWDEIDLDAREWRIPKTRMKGGREHRVPLSDAAMDVLATVEPLRRPSGLVFPSPSRPGSPLSDMTLTKVLRGCGLADRTTVHGLRATFRTWAEERTNVSYAVAEMALAHQVGSSVERTYAKSDLFKKRRRLMNAWARHATGDRAKVVRLRRASN